jgi:hypothetical protein
MPHFGADAKRIERALPAFREQDGGWLAHQGIGGPE